jgi:hypothetical protein
VPRKKSSDSKDEQLLKLKPDIEILRKQFENGQLNVYELSSLTGNSLLHSSIKFIALQQRTSQKRKSAAAALEFEGSSE